MAPVDIERLKEEYTQFTDKVFPRIRALASDRRKLASVLESSRYPKVSLPPVFQTGLRSIEQLFTPLQLGQLSVLRDAVNSVEADQCRELLRLAFSITLDRANRMYTAKGKSTPLRGQSAPFHLRRYQVWDDATELPITDLFSAAFKKVVTAKVDANSALNDFVSADSFRVWEGSATRLDRHVAEESVDYVLTDPPYGRNYNYLDLSMIWNEWLGFDVSDQAYADEIIQGGSRHKSQDDYRNLLGQAIKQIARALKPGRWLTLIYSESKMETWSWLLGACRDDGLRYVDSVWSDSPLPTHKKYQSPYASAAGEFYVNFRKLDERQFADLYSRAVPLPLPDAEDVVRRAIETVVVSYLGANIEVICNTVISRQLLGQDFLERHDVDRVDIRRLLAEHFDPNAGRWQIRDLARVDPGIDAYDLLRYALFHLLSRGPSGGMRPEDISRALPRLLATRGGGLPLEHVPALLQAFASPSQRGQWKIDDRKLARFSQLRLFFDSTTVRTLGQLLRAPGARPARATKSLMGIATLTARLLDHHADMADDAVQLALLAEHVASAVASVIPTAVAAVSAVDELASGRVSLGDDLRVHPIGLLITLRPQVTISDDQQFELSQRIFGPVLNEYHVWFHPMIATAHEAEAYRRRKLDLVVS